MKEFMLLIYNQLDHQANWTAERHQQFLKSCERYIGQLQQDGHLKIAQPLVREGCILAKDLNEAIQLAKGNPEFEFSTTARIEVRPIKSKEETTGYTYPK